MKDKPQDNRMCGHPIAEPERADKLRKCTDQQKGNAVDRSSKNVTPTEKGCRRRKKKVKTR